MPYQTSVPFDAMRKMIRLTMWEMQNIEKFALDQTVIAPGLNILPCSEEPFQFKNIPNKSVSALRSALGARGLSQFVLWTSDG